MSLSTRLPTDALSGSPQELALRPRHADGGQRGGPQPCRDAGGRDLLRATVPARRWETVVLGHFQFTHGCDAGLQLRQPFRQQRAAGPAGLCAQDRFRVRRSVFQPGQEWFCERFHYGPVSDRGGELQRSGLSREREAGGLFAVHPAQRQRFRDSGHGHGIHPDQHQRRLGECGNCRVAAKRRLSVQQQRHRHCPQPGGQRRRPPAGNRERGGRLEQRAGGV